VINDKRAADDAGREAFEAWESYLKEQKQIIGMPGLMARPSFLAGYRAALSSRADGGKDSSDAHRLKVANDCCDRLMQACSDAGCHDGVRMDDWIRANVRADGGKDSSDARDAERYRWLRDQNANSSGAFAVIEDDGGFSSWDACWVGEELDDAIDAAIAGEKK
jgi:hypothetical protein